MTEDRIRALHALASVEKPMLCRYYAVYGDGVHTPPGDGYMLEMPCESEREATEWLDRLVTESQEPPTATAIRRSSEWVGLVLIWRRSK